MTDSGLDPRDQEMIAAFLDRRLSAEERRSFMERLAGEEALYEVFVETVRYRDQRAGGSAAVIEHPASRWRWRRLAAVAALVAVAVATPLLLRGRGGERYAESLVAHGSLDPAPGAEWYRQGWARTRGISSSLDGADAAFRTGVMAVDLEVALRLGRDPDAVDLTRRLERAVGPLELSEILLAYYGQLRERLEAGAPDDELLELAEAAESAFAVQFPDLGAAFRLGRWAEAGRLAAGSGNRKLLVSRSFARALRESRQPAEPWDTPVATQLESIAALLEAPAGEIDLPALETAFSAVIDES